MITVLVVDDNDLVSQGVARCCKTPDILVVGIASTAAEALDVAQEYRPDVVLMDYRLGQDNGVLVASRLLKAVPTSKVVILTGDPNDRTRSEAQEAGCSGCVGKTIRLARELPDIIRRANSGAIL